jgi:hypothetical protein
MATLGAILATPLKGPVTTVVAGLAAVLALAACGGTAAGGAQSTTTSPAVAALHADGYTVIQDTPGNGKLYTDRAEGVKGQQAEQVIVFAAHPSAPVCKQYPQICTAAYTGNTISGPGAQDPGTHARVDGAVLRITGTAAVFRRDGLPLPSVKS